MGGGRVGQFVSHSVSNEINETSRLSHSWMSVDLQDRIVFLEHYCLRGDIQTPFKLRNWVLEGSCDGSQWTILREHENDHALTEARHSEAAWSVEHNGRGYRHFRIRQTGLNSGGWEELSCGGIELYGTLD